MITTKENRETRFSIRATAKQKELIALAAKNSNKTISEFVLENAVEAAEALQLDNAKFIVSGKQYREFLAALDAPPCADKSLRSLMNEANIFDDK